MTRKTYRTAQGRTVDLGALQLQNENIRAVGNMGVNARGDLLDSYNRPIASRNSQVSRQYQRQVTNVTDDRVVSRQVKPEVEIPVPPEDFDDNFDRQESTSQAQTPAPTSASSGGLAAAIARAREVKQELITPPPKPLRRV